MIWNRAFRFGFPAAWLFFAFIVAAESIESTPFPGVRHIHRQETVPRVLSMHLVEIDLRTPGLRFKVTGPNGERPGDTTRETTRSFVARTGAQIGINASFFVYDKTEMDTDIIALAASDGDVYSPAEGGKRQRYNQILNLTKDSCAQIVEADPEDPNGFQTTAAAELYNAVSGDVRLLRDGEIAAPEGGDLHPRTAVGLTARNTLLLFVCDGRNQEHSQGLSQREVAEYLKEYGAVDAIALDGGGSSTLVFADPELRVVNVPVGVMNLPNTERAVGNNIAVFIPVAESRETP
jgi:hypothetical protein